MAVINDARNKNNPNLACYPRKIDKSTLAGVIIPYDHAEIHDGSHFFYKGTTNLALTNDVKYFYIRTDLTSVKYPHIVGDVACNGYLRVQFGLCLNTGATITTAFANNRFSSTNTSESKNSGFTTSSPTGDSYVAEAVLGRDGTTPQSDRGAFGSIGGNREEYILNNNTIYLFKFTALMDDVDINLDIEFYEHEDKF